MRAGKLRHSITIQQRAERRTNDGGFEPQWTDHIACRASIDPKTGREASFADSVRAEMSHLIVIRQPRDEVRPEMRIVFGTRVFNILYAMRPREVRHELHIAAVENLSPAEDSASVNKNQTYTTDELDFTATQSIEFVMPSGQRFYPDKFEVICTDLDGSVTTQPTVTLGINGSTSKYKAATLTTQLSTENSRQGYDTLLDNDGETTMVLGISTAGVVSSAGTYRGKLLVKGVLI
jgi:SPP1 family predicted phage head-tail adaptor